jgi:hypothetical protein
MKLNQAATASLFATVVVSSAASFVREEQLNDVVASEPHASPQDAAKTDNCKAETVALTAKFIKRTQACPKGKGETRVDMGNTITLDYSACDPGFTEAAKKACTAANGVFARKHNNLEN